MYSHSSITYTNFTISTDDLILDKHEVYEMFYISLLIYIWVVTINNNVEFLKQCFGHYFKRQCHCHLLVVCLLFAIFKKKFCLPLFFLSSSIPFALGFCRSPPSLFSLLGFLHPFFPTFFIYPKINSSIIPSSWKLIYICLLLFSFPLSQPN